MKVYLKIHDSKQFTTVWSLRDWHHQSLTLLNLHLSVTMIITRKKSKKKSHLIKTDVECEQVLALFELEVSFLHSVPQTASFELSKTQW